MSETPRTSTTEWKWLRREVIIRDDYECQDPDCDARGGPRGNAELHAHHIVPDSEGGPTEKGNLETLCGDCHRETPSYGCCAEYLPSSQYTREMFVEALDAGEKAQAREVAERVGSSPQTARKYLKESVAEGEVREHRKVTENEDGTGTLIGPVLWSLAKSSEGQVAENTIAD